MHIISYFFLKFFHTSAITTLPPLHLSLISFGLSFFFFLSCLYVWWAAVKYLRGKMREREDMSLIRCDHGAFLSNTDDTIDARKRKKQDRRESNVSWGDRSPRLPLSLFFFFFLTIIFRNHRLSHVRLQLQGGNISCGSAKGQRKKNKNEIDQRQRNWQMGGKEEEERRRREDKP